MNEKKTAIVTGGSGGIGSEICRRLAADGFHVAVHYGSDKDSAARVCAEIQASDGSAMIASANVADEADVASLFAKVTSHFGGVDIAGGVSFLASEDAKSITGQHIRADGGMSN